MVLHTLLQCFFYTLHLTIKSAFIGENFLEIFLFFRLKWKYIFATNFNFLRLIYFQPDGVYISDYHDLTELKA